MNSNYTNWLKEVVNRINFLLKQDLVFFNNLSTSVKPEDFTAILRSNRENTLLLESGIEAFVKETMAEESMDDIFPIHNVIVFKYIGDNSKVNEHDNALIIDVNSITYIFNSYYYNRYYDRPVSVNKAAHYCIDFYHEWLQRTYHHIY